MFDFLMGVCEVAYYKDKLSQIETCDRCNKKKEHKNFGYYKRKSNGNLEHKEYKNDLVDKIKKNLGVVNFYNLDYLLQDYEFSLDKHICKHCCDDVFNQLEFDVAEFYRCSNIKTFSHRYQGRIYLDESVEPYGFCWNGYPENKDYHLNQIKFFAYGEGYDAIIDLNFSFSYRNVQITGKMVKLAPPPKKKPYKAKYKLSAVEQLEKLAKLRDNGILTDEEFEIEKKNILSN